MYTPLVENFCTIPKYPRTDFDAKAVADAEMFKIQYGDYSILCYSWGSGRTILLAHGWGSRASHFAALTRILSSAGFRIVAFDVPGHSSLNEVEGHKYSSMFEFYKTISTVAKNIAPVYAIIGHSLGAAASVMAVRDYLDFCGYKIDVEKIVLISSPAGLESIIASYCRANNLSEADQAKLMLELTEEFNFKTEDCSIVAAIKNIRSKILLVHDYDDNEIPIRDAEALAGVSDNFKTCFTKGAGHFKILANRKMISGVKDFLLK